RSWTCGVQLAKADRRCRHCSSSDDIDAEADETADNSNRNGHERRATDQTRSQPTTQTLTAAAVHSIR
ncbi:MAG: hypothetical protein AAFY28_06090, partial [Actinomycetota bacterium]